LTVALPASAPYLQFALQFSFPPSASQSTPASDAILRGVRDGIADRFFDHHLYFAADIPNMTLFRMTCCIDGAPPR
jgi:hypothetical protein